MPLDRGLVLAFSGAAKADAEKAATKTMARRNLFMMSLPAAH